MVRVNRFTCWGLVLGFVSALCWDAEKVPQTPHRAPVLQVLGLHNTDFKVDLARVLTSVSAFPPRLLKGLRFFVKVSGFGV